MKKIMAIVLCLLMIGQLLACSMTDAPKRTTGKTTKPTISSLMSSCTLTTTTHPDGTTTVTLLPPDVTTNSTGASSVPTTGTTTTRPGTSGTGTPTSTVTVPQVTTSSTVKPTTSSTTRPTTSSTTRPTTSSTTRPTTSSTTRPTTSSTTKPTASTAITPVFGNHTAVPYTQRYYYNQLGTQEQGWYRDIDAAVANLEDSVSLTGDFSDPKWYAIYFIYMFDNPEHFYLGAKVAYSSNGKLLFSYSDGTNNSYHNGADKGDYSSLTATMRTNIRSRKATFDAEVARIIATVPTNIPAVEKQKMLYDRLLIELYYNQSAVWDNVAEPNWNAYGGIVEKRGVCEAYAEAFQTLCYAVGINCTGVVGTANGGGHKWNAVELDGQWYMCDVTFDDPVGGPSGVAKFHTYFNLTSAELFAKGHSTEGSDYPGPTCTATKYSYKNYFG